MAFGTISDPLVAAALWTASVALAATGVLLLVIVVIRIRLLRRLERERRAAEVWNPLLAQCTERVPETLPPLPGRDAEAFLVLWCRAQEVLRGKAQEHLREMARRLGAGDLARALLGSGKLRLQLLALIAFGHLRERGVIPALQPLISHPSPVTSLAAAHALVRIDPVIGLPRLLAAAPRRENWSLARIVSILKECDAKHVAALLSGALRAELEKPDSGQRVARLLRLHVAADGEALRSSVLAALGVGQHADTLAAALAALWHPEDASRARPLLSHPDWVVRVAAARALGRFGGREDVTRLSHALSDRAWWVRHRAAQALCGIPGVDADELRALRDRLTDRFAADALRQALHDRGMA